MKLINASAVQVLHSPYKGSNFCSFNIICYFYIKVNSLWETRRENLRVFLVLIRFVLFFVPIEAFFIKTKGFSTTIRTKQPRFIVSSWCVLIITIKTKSCIRCYFFKVCIFYFFHNPSQCPYLSIIICFSYSN